MAGNVSILFIIFLLSFSFINLHITKTIEKINNINKIHVDINSKLKIPNTYTNKNVPKKAINIASSCSTFNIKFIEALQNIMYINIINIVITSPLLLINCLDLFCIMFCLLFRF